MLQRTDYKYGFSDDIKPKIEFDKGLTPMVIKEISALKNEPKWMLDYRLNSYSYFTVLIVKLIPLNYRLISMVFIFYCCLINYYIYIS